VVELALITPILIVLFSGMVEIGWFANNYLTLLDVTRAGARRGATLQNQMAPQGWNNMASYMPTQMLPLDWQAQRIGFMPYNSDASIADQELSARAGFRPSENPSIPLDYQSSGCGSTQFLGFYNDIVCTMQSSLSPLTLDRENGVDDVIVSAFALEVIDPRRNIPPDTPGLLDQPWLGGNRPIPGDVPQAVVVGRYPSNANECEAVETAPGSSDFSTVMDPRDPFDFNQNQLIDRRTPEDDAEGVSFPYVFNDDYSEVDPGYDGTQVDLNLREKQVGFVWFGQHRIEIEQADGRVRRTLCLGSQWSIADVEALINLTGYVPTSAPNDRGFMPGTGLVLVELHWQHEMLLKLPVFNPVFNLMSPDGQPPTIYVWAAFPLPSTDPSIQFR
jgi:hypothetical protein